jgi:hypothetical protein
VSVEEPLAVGAAVATGGVAAAALQEYTVVTAAHSKPHALAALLLEVQQGALRGQEVQQGAGHADGLQQTRIVVFASAVAAVRRLAALAHALQPSLGLPVHEMSSRVAPRAQAAVMAALRQQPSWCAPPARMHCMHAWPSVRACRGATRWVSAGCW